jgi:hypothetical protein
MAFDILVEHGGTSLKDYISALLKPLQTNTDSLKTFETENKKRAKFNGQKIVLQEALNNIFGVSVAPFILVEINPGIGGNTYFFEPAELQSVYFSEASELAPINMYEASELTSVEYDFKVRIPVGIHSAELERRVRAETTLYKLAGTKFIIETY